MWEMNDMEPKRRAQQIVQISVRNTVLNFVLAGLKIAAGFASGSYAAIADGFNSLFDGVTTIAVVITNHFTKAEQDEEHPYGHEKIESMATLLIAVFLAVTALYTGYQGVLRLFARQTIHQAYWPLIATAVSAGVKLFMFYATQKAAQNLQSDTLGLVAADYRFDSMLSCAVFVGVLLAMLHIPFAEPLVAVGATCVLLKSAVEYFIKAFNQLTDRAADAAATAAIRQIVLQCAQVQGIDALLTRIHGNALYVDVEISVDATLSVLQGHTIAQTVHDKLEQAPYPKIKHCMVHINPFR